MAVSQLENVSIAAQVFDGGECFDDRVEFLLDFSRLKKACSLLDEFTSIVLPVESRHPYAVFELKVSKNLLEITVYREGVLSLTVTGDPEANLRAFI